jgi:hypothetical protein
MLGGVMNIFRNVKYGIGNLIKWFPVIWKDRDWDHWFLYVILQFKLKQMEKLQRKYGHSVNSETYANQIKTAVLILDRLIKDDYFALAHEKHEKKWGRSKMIFTPIPENPELCSMDFVVEKAVTNKQKEQERKELMRLLKHEEMLKQQDLDYLFKYIRKYIQGWWD